MKQPPPPPPSPVPADPVAPPSRSALRPVGELLVVAALLAEIGGIVSGADGDDLSAGDFFSNAGGVQFFIVPLTLIGLLVLRVEEDARRRRRQPPRLANLLFGIGFLVAAVSSILGAGATVTYLSRLSNDDEFAFSSSNGDWLLGAGITVAALATLLVALGGLRAGPDTPPFTGT